MVTAARLILGLIHFDPLRLKQTQRAFETLMCLLGTQSKAYAALQEILVELHKFRELQEHQAKQTRLDETLMHFYGPKQEEDPVMSDDEAREFDSVQRTLARARKGQWGSQQ
jgi:hypothetical protein